MICSSLMKRRRSVILTCFCFSDTSYKTSTGQPWVCDSEWVVNSSTRLSDHTPRLRQGIYLFCDTKCTSQRATQIHQSGGYPSAVSVHCESFSANVRSRQSGNDPVRRRLLRLKPVPVSLLMAALYGIAKATCYVSRSHHFLLSLHMPRATIPLFESRRD